MKNTTKTTKAPKKARKARKATPILMKDFALDIAAMAMNTVKAHGNILNHARR